MKLQFTTTIINEILQCELLGVNDVQPIHQIVTDSRNYFGESHALFIAIKGPLHDGHLHIKELYEKGIHSFIIDHDIDSNMMPLAQFFKVDNSIKALQKIAHYHRKQFTYPIIAITGSNGKTIVKEWLYQLLKGKYSIIRSPKSFNSQLGVPLSLLQLSDKHNLAIIEAGVSKPGEMELLANIIGPTYGVLTSIGTAHSENFDSGEHILKEKSKLFSNTIWFHNFADNQKYITSIIKKNHQTSLVINYHETRIAVSIPFEDDAAIQNAVTCALVGLKLGVSPLVIESELPRFPQIALRLETRKGKNNTTIIDDSYSNDVPSLKIALDFLTKQDQHPTKILILSDVQQDKQHPTELYFQIAQLINERKLTHFIGVGNQILNFKHLFENSLFFETTQHCLEYFKANPPTNATLLLKGARVFQFEKIGKLLEEKTHETRLTIDLNAIRNNISVYRNLLQPDTRLLCMIKAFGYGAGSKEIGAVLAKNNIDYFGVAYADEGIELRNEGIKTPVIVMNAEEGSFDEIISNKLEPSIYSFRQLDKFIRALIDHQIKSYPIHIKIDSGMKRLGFLTDDMDELITTITSQPEVRVKSVFSHLAAADNPKEDVFTNKQIQIFDYCAQKLETGLGYTFLKHILNTSGIERFSNAHYDMVRLGLGLYGSSETIKTLEPVGTLSTVISQIKTVKKGESVGYSRNQYALEDTLIGVIPIGYADGFSRRLSKGVGHVWVNGKLAPTIGNVCMDMTMINLNGITAKEGDEVEIFGRNRPIQDLASELETITYEIMTTVSHRVVRIYVE